VSSVRVEQLGDRTDCTGWDVRALVNHMCMGNHFVAQAVDGGDAGPEYERDFVGDDHAAAYERSRDDLLRAFSAPGALERMVQFPGMQLPAEFALNFALMDTVVHRWDLARAVGLDPQISADVAASMLERIRPMVPDEIRAATAAEATATVPFGPIVDVPETASPVDKLVAFLGRTP
jgi:uncharacterized protein (TIGR03086 family)